MKKTLLLICSLAIATLMQALTINNTAGGLATALGAELTTCTSLTVTGEIDARDFKTMRDAMTALTTIDLSGANVVAYTGIGGTASTASTTYAANTLPGRAFYNKSKLTSIITPSSVTSIGESAFDSCRGLTSVTISSSVTSIGSSAFSYCDSLTTITIPNSVTSIGIYAFRLCSGLTSITIPSSVNTIEQGAFETCSGLINVDVNNLNYSSIDGVLYNKTQTTLIQLPDSKTGSFTIPSSVTSIGNSAFYSCSDLTSVTIPSSVTSIGKSAFWGCSRLTTVTIPNSVTSIEIQAFAGCHGLTSVTIPNSVTSIVDYTFQNCSGLTTVSIPSSVTSIGTDAFDSCSKLISVTIPSSVTTIGSGAFQDCSGLNSVTIPSSVTSIGSLAFQNCSGLITVDVNNNNCSSVDGVLYSKTRVSLIHCSTSKTGSFTILSSVTSIGSWAFQNCVDLTSVTIPSSVTTIKSCAFQNCSGLTSIKVFSSTPSSVIIGTTIFDNVNKTTCILYVPTGSKALYQAAAQWKDFTNIVEFNPNAIYTPEVGNYNISITSNLLTITNAPQGESVIVYKINGSVISNQKATGSEVEVVLPAHGVYIVKVGAQSEKVVY